MKKWGLASFWVALGSILKLKLGLGSKFLARSTSSWKKAGREQVAFFVLIPNFLEMKQKLSFFVSFEMNLQEANFWNMGKSFRKGGA